MGPLYFALRFPRDLAEGWRRIFERFVPLLLALCFAVILATYTRYISFGEGIQRLLTSLNYAQVISGAGRERASRALGGGRT